MAFRRLFCIYIDRKRSNFCSEVIKNISISFKWSNGGALNGFLKSKRWNIIQMSIEDDECETWMWPMVENVTKFVHHLFADETHISLCSTVLTTLWCLYSKIRSMIYLIPYRYWHTNPSIEQMNDFCWSRTRKRWHTKTLALEKEKKRNKIKYIMWFLVIAKYRWKIQIILFWIN